MANLLINLGVVNSLHRRDIMVLMGFLEETHRLCPLIIKKHRINSSEVITFSSEKIQPKDVPFYHPLQFFEVFRWYIHSTIKKPPYHLSSQFREYFRIRKLKLNISDLEDEIINLKGLGLDTNHTENYILELRSKLENISNQDDYDLEGRDLFKKLKTSWVRNMINENSLMVWIKIESLLFYRNSKLFGRNFSYMEPIGSINTSEDEIEQFKKDYLEWREKIYENPQKFLTEGEIKLLKEFQHTLYSEINNGDFPIQGKWSDLFDIISINKLDNIKGYSNYYLNLITIKRYIDRVFWKLYGVNLNYPYRPEKKPGFYFNDVDDDIKEFIDYKKSILTKFNLLVDNPFILYVDGETEKNIIDEYQSARKGFFFNIKNMGGMDKYLFYVRITENVKEHDSFFFFDYDNLDKYEKFKKYTNENHNFFFPDFITENFTPDQMFQFLEGWLYELDIEFAEDLKTQIKQKLLESKEESDELIKQINSEEEITLNRPKGYEVKISEFLRKKFAEKLANKYPERIELNNYGEITQIKKFNQLMKTELSDRIKFVVLDSIEEDPNRSFKFPFEVKLGPFYERINIVINRT